MLKYGFLTNNTVMVSVAHTDKILRVYENALDKTFKLLSKLEKKELKFNKKIKIAYKGFYRLN